jgi:hypothetical protein
MNTRLRFEHDARPPISSMIQTRSSGRRVFWSVNSCRASFRRRSICLKNTKVFVGVAEFFDYLDQIFRKATAHDMKIFIRRTEVFHQFVKIFR